MRILRSWLATGILLVLFLAVGAAEAHESLPAYLEIQEQQPGTFDVLWKVPAVEGTPPAITFLPPPTCHALTGPTTSLTPGAVTQRWSMQCRSPSLAGQRIEVEGLHLTLLDAVVRVQLSDGSVISRILRPTDPAFVVGTPHDRPEDSRGYLRLGIEHILYGIDHLLFILGLLLIVRGWSPLLKTITAFTVAHTITLALAVMGVVRVPAAPVETVIALSIVFLASELVQFHRGRAGLTYRRPWMVAFSFGLLHGFGFAGTLSWAGIPKAEIPGALLLFNCGVELGQLGFVGAFLGLAQSLQSLEIRWPRRAEWAPPYAFGSLAASWFIQRCVSMF